MIPPADDASWEFDYFFEANSDKFLQNPEQKNPFFEWVRDGENAPLQLEGASVLIVRPGRHCVGAIDSDTWLRLISWHGRRATTTWNADVEVDAPGRGAITLIVDRQGSGLRNQDPVLLRALLPPLTRHFPFALHKAYVAPVNILFYAIWKIAKTVLPKAVTARFTILRGADWKERLTEELGPEVTARLEQ